ncbi:hypothetical protein ACFLRY_03940 [Bacteroidota bacterium]
MIKKVLFIALAMIAMVACNNTQQQANTENTEEEQVAEAIIITPENFQDVAADYIGQEVRMEGTIVHVCKHGGKKLFIMGTDPEKRIKINAPDDMAAFQPELEGNYIAVIGIVEEIEVEEPEMEEGEVHEEDAEHENYYHKPQYSIMCVDYKVKEAPISEETEELIEE